MRSFKADKYKEFVAEKGDPTIEKHESDEIKLIKSIENLSGRTVVDLGAGYGRAVSHLCKYVRNIVAIEINPDMYGDLFERAKRWTNVSVVVGDITKLTEILKEEDVVNPVFIILENTLGTIEGDYKKVLKEMRYNARYYKGDIVLSLYRQQALKTWGIRTYQYGEEMYGEVDFNETDFKNGLFVSKTGYTSKWWKDAEIKRIKKYFGGVLVNEIVENQYWIFRNSLR